MTESLVNNLRSILVALLLLCFVVLCFMTYSKRAKAGFDEAAQLPLTEDDLPASPADRKE